MSHLQDWDNPRFRTFFEALGQRFSVTRYDRTGVGLSDRERASFTLEEEVSELSAVIDAVESGPVCILAMSCGSPTAIGYAAAHPARVRAMVFFGGYVEGRDLGADAMRDAMQGLVRASWGLGSRTIADLMAPELDKDQLDELSRNHQRAASPETAARLLGLSYSMSSRSIVSKVSAPALVLHREKDRTVPFQRGVNLAAALDDAKLLSLPGSAHVMWEGEQRGALSAMVEFLGSTLGREAWATGEELADAALASGPSMRRRGDLWEIRYADRLVHVAQSKGLEDLAVLLANPNSDVRALDLMMQFAVDEVDDPGSDPVLDERARAEFAERVALLETELDKAQTDRDLGRVAILRREREFILAELERNVANLERARKFTGPAERARKAVTARVRAAADKIREVHAPLAAHLDASLRTGLMCSYRPDPPEIWSVSS